MMPSLDFSIGLEYVLPPLFTASAHCTPFLELCQSSAQNTSLKRIQRFQRGSARDSPDLDPTPAASPEAGHQGQGAIVSVSNIQLPLSHTPLCAI